MTKKQPKRRVVSVDVYRLKKMLTMLIDFLGTDGVVNPSYRYKADRLCEALRSDLRYINPQGVPNGQS
jgi:hypothetical protein